jgi:hypothetical protein
MRVCLPSSRILIRTVIPCRVFEQWVMVSDVIELVASAGVGASGKSR